MRRTAEDLGVGDTFRKTPVGIYFGLPVSGRRPLLRRRGPATGRLHPVRQLHGRMPGRAPRTRSCKNYLALAERLGVVVEPMRTVTRLGVVPGHR